MFSPAKLSAPAAKKSQAVTVRKSSAVAKKNQLSGQEFMAIVRNNSPEAAKAILEARGCKVFVPAHLMVNRLEHNH